MFTFHSEDQMNALVAKANKPVAKLGLDPIRVLSVTPRKVADGVNFLGEPHFTVVYDAELSIPGALVQLYGQEVVARLEDVGGINLLTRISQDPDLNLDAYRAAAPTCQHCNLKRSRKASWIVRDDVRGLIQVGDNCVSLYFGVDVEAILSATEKVFRFLGEDDGEDEGWGCGGRRAQFSFGSFTSVIVWKSMTAGFVTKKQAGDYGVSTADFADFLARPCHAEGKAKHDYQEARAAHLAWRELNFKGVDLFEQALDWWLDRKHLTEFEHNCKAAILSQSPKFLGLAAFGIKLWAEATVAARETKDSKHVGAPKDKLAVDVVVVRLGSYETAFGTKTVVTFEDNHGNLLVWKASCDPKVTLGQHYNLRGTIKGHSTYKGVAQTDVTRCYAAPLVTTPA